MANGSVYDSACVTRERGIRVQTSAARSARDPLSCRTIGAHDALMPTARRIPSSGAPPTARECDLTKRLMTTTARAPQVQERGLLFLVFLSSTPAGRTRVSGSLEAALTVSAPRWGEGRDQLKRLRAARRARSRPAARCRRRGADRKAPVVDPGRELRLVVRRQEANEYRRQILVVGDVVPDRSVMRRFARTSSSFVQRMARPVIEPQPVR